jgi:nucleoside-diphosphate-sugar epimerase
MPDSVNYPRKPVLVLGASGTIGSRVVAALATSPIYRPVAASRRSGVDATDPARVRAALQDVDTIVNCIAGPDRTMVRSTQALCDAARIFPPRRIVHLSSMAVYGAATGTVREDHPAVPPVSGYGQAKIDCEGIVRKYVNDGGDAVILRPTCVFGPNSPQWTTRLARLLAGIAAALDAPDIAGRAFNVSSTNELTWNEFLVAFAMALGATPVRRIPARTLRIETTLLAPLRRIGSLIGRAPVTEAITPSLAALWRQDIRIDCSAAEAMLGLLRTPVDQMIAAAVRPQSNPMEAAV